MRAAAAVPLTAFCWPRALCEPLPKVHWGVKLLQFSYEKLYRNEKKDESVDSLGKRFYTLGHCTNCPMTSLCIEITCKPELPAQVLWAMRYALDVCIAHGSDVAATCPGSADAKERAAMACGVRGVAESAARYARLPTLGHTIDSTQKNVEFARLCVPAGTGEGKGFKVSSAEKRRRP